MTELATQITYLQDTTNIILSDVGGMQSNIQKTLEAESSMIETYTIDVTDMDFNRGTYDVDITVIPKEYTDKTTISLFFGTNECQLKQDGYSYKGTATLPLDKDFNGNLTFLIANSKKKNTEVIEDYKGLCNNLDQVLSGSLTDVVNYKDGELSLDAECNYALDGLGQYEFESLDVIAQMGEKEIWNKSLMYDILGQDSPSVQLPTTEQDEASQTDIISPVNGGSGMVDCEFSYELSEDEAVIGNPDVRIYLSAVTTEGYRFEYDLFGGSDSVVYDLRGGKLELD
jgi:hypothetical protein